MKNTFFTSDTHFSHNLVARLRGFVSIEEMNDVLIDNWNSVVNKGDDVYHMGDFSFTKNTEIPSFVNKLNGNIYLIRGNHDNFGLSDHNSRGFSWVKDYYELHLKDIKQRFVLFHYPIRSWHWNYKGVIHLYGHTHHTIDQNWGKSMDVGIDNPLCEMKPFHLDQIMEIMKDKENKIVDHHGEENK